MNSYMRVLREHVEKGNVKNISTLLRNGSYKKETKAYVNRNLKNIADANRYPHQNTFKELVKYHVDVTSPLRRLPIIDDYIVITPSQKIPYCTNDFLRLLSKTTLKGMRVLFDLHLKDNKYLTIAEPSQSYNPFIFYNKNGTVDVVSFRYSENRSHTNLTVASFDNNVTFSDEVENFSKFFDVKSEFPTILESNGYRIFSDRNYILSKNLLDDEIEGFVMISGLDENGMILTNNGKLIYSTCIINKPRADFRIITRNTDGSEEYLSLEIRSSHGLENF